MLACSRCGVVAPVGSRFCPGCGAELAGPGPREERKRVSVLFVDQVGSTARADGADPEDVRDRNRVYYEETRARIEKHGGTLEKYAGDAVMAVFGVPLAKSNDAESAVRAALSVLDGIRELNAKHLGLDLEVRVGVCTGEAMVEIDPPPESAIATGDVVNTAARLQSSAPPGCAIVGPETYRLTRQAFRYRALPPVAAKGKRELVPAWVVERVLGFGESHRSGIPLVGRTNELLLIRALWARTAGERQPHLVSLIGPAGIGKSRLAREVSAEVEASGGRVLWGRCLAYEQQTPFHAVAGIIRQAAGVLEGELGETAREKMASLVAAIFPPDEVASASRYLSLLMGLGLDERAREAIDIHYAARRFFENLSESSPLMVVFDDLHWADDASLDLVEYLSSRIRDRRVLIVALGRPELLESRPAWGSGVAGHTTLSLNPLGGEDAGRAASELLPDASPAIVERVVTIADGNPLFIEELAASVGEDPAATDLPPTISAVIAARIDALPPGARSALLRASVIGKSFSRAVLEKVGGTHGIDSSLDTLEGRGLIQRGPPSGAGADFEYSFKHDLVLDSAYGTLPRATRRELHAAVAAAMEELAAKPTEIVSLLAHHWREGGRPDRARAYLLIAAGRAIDAIAVEEAYDIYSQALELATEDAERHSIRFLRAQALVQLESYARADDELEQLIPSLQGERRIEALIERAHATLWTERTEETMSGAEAALELARKFELRDLEASALGLVAAAHGMRGEAGDLARAVELGEEALRLWQPGARRRDLAELHHMAGNHYYWAGDYNRAIEATELAATTAGVDLHSQEFRLRGAGMRGVILAGVGRYQEAIVAAEYAIELARDMGRPTSVVLNYSTLPLREVFALDDALARSEEVADNLGPSDFNMPWMNARADVFTAMVMRGDYSRADRAWGVLWDDAVESKAWERWLVSGRLAAVRAELELATGDTDEAIRWARRAVDLAVASGRRKYDAIARTTLGRALTTSGHSAEAVSELRVAVATATSLGSPAIVWQARAALADALENGGQDPDAERAEAARVAQSIASGLAPERAARFLAEPAVAALLEAAT